MLASAVFNSSSSFATSAFKASDAVGTSNSAAKTANVGVAGLVVLSAFSALASAERLEFRRSLIALLLLFVARSSSKAVTSVSKVSTFFSASDFSAGFGASGFADSTGASSSLTPPLYSGVSDVGASSSLTPSLYSGTSTLGVASSPAVPREPLYSLFSTGGSTASPFSSAGVLVATVPVYSGSASTVGVFDTPSILPKISLYSSVSSLISSELACNDSLTSSNLVLASLVSACNCFSAVCKASRTA